MLTSQTTLPPTTVFSPQTTTQTITATQTSTTVVPNCFPINGCINSNSSWSAVPSTTDPLFCQYYCTGVGGCLSWQIGNSTNGEGLQCNMIGLAGWRAWDPDPAPSAVAPGVGGGGNCSAFWIYERECPFIPGFP
jgi:hypothetical protein